MEKKWTLERFNNGKLYYEKRKCRLDSTENNNVENRNGNKKIKENDMPEEFMQNVTIVEQWVDNKREYERKQGMRNECDKEYIIETDLNYKRMNMNVNTMQIK